MARVLRFRQVCGLLSSGHGWSCWVIVGTHLGLKLMTLTLPGLLDMDLSESSLAVTLLPVLDTLYTMPVVELYRPLVREITWSPIWMSFPSLSCTKGSVGGPLS